MITNHDPKMIDRIAIGVLILLTIVAALTFRDYGLGWDDYTHSQYGELLLSFYTSGFKDQRALSFINLYYYGGGFDMAALLLSKILPFGLFETRRLLGAVTGLIGLFTTWRLARRIGGPFAGLIALALLATCPLYVGHVFINAKDAPFAVAMVVFLLGLVRAIEEYPRPSPATVLILGLGFGLSIGSRIMSGFGVLTAIIAILFLFAIEARTGFGAAARRVGRFWLALIPAAILAYIAMGIVWPWAVVDPTNPIKAIGYFAHFFEKPWQELFEGVPIEPPDMPRRYVLVLMGLKLPEIFLLLGSAGVAGMLIAAIRAGDARRRAILLSVGLAALLPIAVTVLTRPAMYNGIRHFVFVMPPLAIAGGLASDWIERRAIQIGRWAAMACAAIFLIGIASPVIEMIRLHPYEYVHFNRIAGGIQGAYRHYMLDYWGLSFKQAAWSMLAKLGEKGDLTPPPGRKWKVAVCGPHPPAQYALGPDFEPTWDPKGADFALMLGEFYCARLDAPLLAEVKREGIIFARAYDLRGRTINQLFTRPPIN
ncbi:MAG: glycosyltransferase family 39 protein [Pseudomonadota bacterium]